MKGLWGMAVGLALCGAGCSDGTQTETPDGLSGNGSSSVAAAPVAVSGIAEQSTAPLGSLSFNLLNDPPTATSVDDIRDVNLSVHVNGTWAAQDLTVEFVSPSGTVYERQVHPVSSSMKAEQVVTFRLPVAGTFIDANSLSGHWQARIWLNGVERTLQPFELAQ